MQVWNQGYLAELPYPHHVQPQLAPSWLVALQTALGQRAGNLQAGFRYCELGCGQGLNSLLLAASNPAGQFVAVDFNPQHIEHGRRLAAAAQLSNIEFVQADFTELLAQPGEGYDFIVAHGVYSWVAPAQRAAIRGFVEQRLKTNGLLCLGYMCQPGMAPLAAAQRFIWQHAQHSEGSPPQRVQAALEALQVLQQGGAGYFVEQPEMARLLARSAEQGLDYLAHELLCEHWQPLQVADVMAEFASLGCQLIGSAIPLENIDAVSLPGNCLAAIQGLTDPALRETAKDLARNQAQRSDLYQRGDQALSATEHRQALLDSCWALLPAAPAPAPGAVEFSTRIGPLQGAAELYQPLLQALGEGPQSFAELARRPALTAQVGQLSGALQLLTWAGYAHPLLHASVDVTRCQALNRLLAEGTLQGVGYAHLAAPSLGASVSADMLEMAAARVLLEHPQLRGTLLSETIQALLRRYGLGVEQVVERVQHFEQRTLPSWQVLGVLP
ncbi:class I SAM-dependent methyltransferase [Pseudomonas anguilliseptica]|uniref:class I SAM-dependent methyltransferase n=1 Tax=Pseudomonas anguilliseptica TaxID=53406 RepID=UPI00325AB790